VEWITAREAGRRLGVTHPLVPRIAALNGVRIRVLAGVAKTKYLAEDIDRLAASMVQVATRQTERATA